MLIAACSAPSSGETGNTSIPEITGAPAVDTSADISAYKSVWDNVVTDTGHNAIAGDIFTAIYTSIESDSVPEFPIKLSFQGESHPSQNMKLWGTAELNATEQSQTFSAECIAEIDGKAYSLVASEMIFSAADDEMTLRGDAFINGRKYDCSIRFQGVNPAPNPIPDSFPGAPAVDTSADISVYKSAGDNLITDTGHNAIAGDIFIAILTSIESGSAPEFPVNRSFQGENYPPQNMKLWGTAEFDVKEESQTFSAECIAEIDGKAYSLVASEMIFAADDEMTLQGDAFINGRKYDCSILFKGAQAVTG